MNKISLKGYSEKEVYLLYEIKDEYLVVVKTFVDVRYRGKGLAKKLLIQFLEDTKTINKKITATCSYAQSFLLKYEDERIDKEKIKKKVSACHL